MRNSPKFIFFNAAESGRQRSEKAANLPKTQESVPQNINNLKEKRDQLRLAVHARISNNKLPQITEKNEKAIQAFRKGNLKEFWQATFSTKLSGKQLYKMTAEYFGKKYARRLNSRHWKKAIEIKILAKIFQIMAPQLAAKENINLVNNEAPKQLSEREGKMSPEQFATLGEIADGRSPEAANARNLLRQAHVIDAGDGFNQFNKKLLHGKIYFMAEWKHYFSRPLLIKRGRRIFSIVKMDNSYRIRYKRRGKWHLSRNRFTLQRNDLFKPLHIQERSKKNITKQSAKPAKAKVLTKWDQEIANEKKTRARLEMRFKQKQKAGNIDQKELKKVQNERIYSTMLINFAEANKNLAEKNTGSAMRKLDYVIRDAQKLGETQVLRKAIKMKRIFIFNVLNQAEAIINNRQQKLGKWYKNTFAKYAQLNKAFINREGVIIRHLKLMFKQDPRAHNLTDTIKKLTEHYRKTANWRNNGNNYANKLEEGSSLAQSILNLNRSESDQEKKYNLLKLADSLGLQAGTTILAPEQTKEIYYTLLNKPIFRATNLLKKSNPTLVKKLRLSIMNNYKQTVQEQVEKRINSLEQSGKVKKRDILKITKNITAAILNIMAENAVQKRAIDQYLINTSPYLAHAHKYIMKNTDKFEKEALIKLQQLNNREFLGSAAEFIITSGLDYLTGAKALKMLKNSTTGAKFILGLQKVTSTPGYKGLISSKLVTLAAGESRRILGVNSKYKILSE